MYSNDKNRADIYSTLAVVKYDIGLTQSTCTCTCMAIEITCRTNLVRIIVKVMLKQ